MRSIVTALLIASAAGSLGCDGQTRRAGAHVEHLGEEQFFLVSIEQAGRTVPIDDGRVKLRKAPFTVVLSFRRLDGVMVHASPEPVLAAAVRAGRPASSVLPIARKALPENLLNPEQKLYVHPEQYGYWYYLGPTIHCFDDVRQHDGRFHCRRTIARYETGPDATATSISAYRPAALHLTFVKADLAGREPHRVERHAETLTVAFE